MHPEIQNPAVALAVKSAAEGFGLSPELIVENGKGTTRRNWARQSAVYLTAKSGLITREIADAFGCAESVVYHSVREVESRLTVKNWDATWCECHAKAAAAFEKGRGSL